VSVGQTELKGMRSVLDRSAEIPDAAALLALANWWLYGPGLRLLMSELTQTVVVALVIEHADDPLGVYRVLSGVVALLRSGVTLIPLRCDVSGRCRVAEVRAEGERGRRRSERLRELGERRRQPEPRRAVEAEFVEAAAEVLDEGVSGCNDRRASQPFQAVATMMSAQGVGRWSLSVFVCRTDASRRDAP